VPRNWRKAINAVRESGGAFVTVSDDAIRQAMRLTGEKAGIFAEPAAAAAVAGVAEAVTAGVIEPRASVAAFITGSGLKDIRGAVSALSTRPSEIAPQLDLVKKLIEERG